MANTADLLALQTEYPTAFADPEAAPPESTGTGLGDAIAANLEIMQPDQVRDFAEGHLRAQTEPDEPSVLDELVAQWERKYPDGFVPDDSSEAMTHYDWCQFHLLQLEYEPNLMEIAAEFLEELATIAGMRKHLANEPIRSALQKAANEGQLDHIFNKSIVIDLPETNARQGSEGCASGMCDL